MARGLDKTPGTYGIDAFATVAITNNPPAGGTGGGLFAVLDTDRKNFKLSTAGGAIHGIIESNVAAGAAGHIRMDGIAHIKLGGVVADDAYLQSGALGVGITWDGSSPVGGKCLKGGNSGDVVTVQLGAVPSGAIGAATSQTDGNGGSETYVVNSEEITLSLVGATTDSVANLLPANSEILGFAFYWTEAGVALTNWAAGDATTAARFHAADTVFTLGASGVDLAVRNPANTNAAGPVQVAAAKLRITQTGTQATAGKVRVVVYARTLAAPTA